jgi:succinoglycan biosynthesis protein ExoO
MSALQTEPDVTFVVAAYNAADTLVAAIDSALAQDNVSLEVVVVDDCSPDDTRAVVQAVAECDPRVKLIALDNNLGPGGARNAGIDAAQGRWIAVLDSDDVVYPDRMAQMIMRAEKANADIAVDNLDVVYSDGRPRETMFEPAFLEAKRVLTLEDFIRSNILFKSTFNFGYIKPIFRRDFLNGHGLRFRHDLRIGEDYLLLASALASGASCVIEPMPGYVYNIRQGSISRVLELHHVDAMIAADKEFLRQFTLLPAAMDAQVERTKSLIQARHFLMLVDSIKRRSVSDTIRIALRDPSALKHLRMPISVRLQKLKKTLLTSALFSATPARN